MGIRILLRALAAAALVLLACPPAPGQQLQDATAQETTCIVAHVLDGDTLDCRGGPRIRLIGIDAPEMDQAPFGAAARAALANLARQGAHLRAVIGVERLDRHGRTLAYLYDADGTFINVAMARNGYAVDLPIPPNVRHAAAIRTAVAAARESGAGLWRIDGFACLPARHRRRLC
jgi:micrococcal nuclease